MGDRVVEREWEAECDHEKEEDEQEIWAYVGEGGVRSTGKEKPRRGRGCERLRLMVLEKVRDTYTGVWVLCSE